MMVYTNIKRFISQEMSAIKESGLFKDERLLRSPQGSKILTDSKEVINFCANNYLGLSNHPEIVRAAKEGLEQRGYGMSSVRFICGTQDQHKLLEKNLAKFLKTDDAILYSSCFDANTGLFETILTAEDAILSDELNHASIIDGIRLCKAERHVFKHSTMEDLREHLKQTKDKRFRLIATDGVFSMDGDVAKLKEITELAEQYDAMVMVDDSHSTGFFGPTGRGSVEHCGVMGKIDIITSTLGKALGGASGGFTAGRQEIVDFLRQRSRPYLFSNSLAPPIVAASLKALGLLETSGALRKTLNENTLKFRKAMAALGFTIPESVHPIVPIMLGEARLAKDMADALLKEGIYVIGFSYPVVPKDRARIRVQISAAHTPEQIDQAIIAFEKVGKQFNVI